MAVGACSLALARYPPLLHRRYVLLALFAFLFAPACSCGHDSSSSRAGEEERKKLPIDDDLDLLDEPKDASKLVYLVSKDAKLWSFDPTRAGMAAYDLIGPLTCDRYSNPQSMAVDRKGVAWVFYDSRKLYRVSTADASCTPTNYVHPAYQSMLGMGFTSMSPGSDEEQLYIMSPSFGLGTIQFPGLGVNQLGSSELSGAELTGGGDARLFAFEATRGRLHEIDRRSMGTRLLYELPTNGMPVRAWAFARYAGRFYFFTADYQNDSKCVEVDVDRKLLRVRDADIGTVIVGAGQSTLVPPRDSSDSIAGDWPDGGL